MNPKKVGLTAYLFLFSYLSFGSDPIWKFDSNLENIYQLVINLQTDKANELLTKIHTNELHKLYVESFNETLYILISEDHQKFIQIEENFKKRQKYLESLPQNAESLFLQAELSLQKGFCYLNLGQEINAVFSIRKAYQLTLECEKKYPTFIPIKKTSGVIQVMVGTIPEKYQWFMTLLGMKGSVVNGQKKLSEVSNSSSSLSKEGTILFYTIKGFINQQFGEASNGIKYFLETQPDNRLLLFIGVNMLIKDGRSEEALSLINKLDKLKEGLPMHYIDYLHAEILLQKGEYSKAISYYKQFIKYFPSQSFKKDSNYKISLCYWLLNDQKTALEYFNIAKVTGTDKADPDRYAAKQLEESTLPNKKLLKVRYSTDGGYFKEASAELNTINLTDLPTIKDKTEYYYRKARLAHRMGEISAAKLFYQQSIDMTRNNPWYFGANSALQLGYIAKDQKDYPSAKKFFQQALSYPRHEYKSSIDNKAKSELELLETIKS
jgi:tetratricopeptide (TPR) repeat protein